MEATPWPLTFLDFQQMTRTSTFCSGGPEISSLAYFRASLMVRMSTQSWTCPWGLEERWTQRLRLSSGLTGPTCWMAGHGEETLGSPSHLPT